MVAPNLKTNKMRTLVEFTKDFATKKKGDTMELDSQLAATLIHDKKVAKKRLRKTKEED